jgi:hypothetical protein
LPLGNRRFRPPGRVTFLFRQKKSNQKKGRPTVPPLRGSLRCSQKPAGLELAALKQPAPLISDAVDAWDRLDDEWQECVRLMKQDYSHKLVPW